MNTIYKIRLGIGIVASGIFALGVFWYWYSVTSSHESNNNPYDFVQFTVIGDYGNDTPPEYQVSMLLDTLAPEFIITTGDNSYGSNDIDKNIGKYYSKYIGNYIGEYGEGSAINRFFPALELIRSRGLYA